MSLVAWSLGGVCFGLGLVAALMARARIETVPVFALPLVWLLALAAFGLTVPAEPAPYFQAGGALGWGVLTASGLWLMGAFVGHRLHYEWLGALLPIAAPMLALLLIRDNLLPALWGVGIATGLMWVVLRGAWASLEGVALSVLALSWTTGLAVYANAPRWFGVCLAGSSVAAFGMATLLARAGRTGWRISYILLFGGFALTAVGYRLSGSDAPWLELTLLTLIAATLARALSGSEVWSRYALLVWVGLLTAAFATMRGFGLAVCALMTALHAMVMGHREFTRTLPHENALYTAGALLLVSVLGFRLFTLSYPLRPPRADLYLYFTLVAFLIALIGLGALALWWRQRGERSPLWRSVLAGFWAAAAPLALTAVFTERAAAGWSAGALSATISAYLYGNRLFHWLAPLSLLGLIIMLPLGSVAAVVADSPRNLRIGVAIGLTVALALTAIAIALVDSRSATQTDD
ncbi:MAG: hypothetical protein KatS3mg019_1768 [Fimbriimonadales bacterium]|nr:MAG: hypothetical protein KatS3mg019_1768 [Fimbriimonadales bacterium]